MSATLKTRRLKETSTLPSKTSPQFIFQTTRGWVGGGGGGGEGGAVDLHGKEELEVTEESLMKAG